MEQKDYSSGFEIKSDNNENLVITGYASVFGVADNYNDIITKGAFADATADKVKLLWQHDHKQPIGVIDNLYEDEKGLFIEASINCKIAQGSETAALIRQRALDGLSIGFSVNKSAFGKNGERIITDIKLWEISVVTFPANTSSIISKIGEKYMSLDKASENRIRSLENKFSQYETMLARPDIGGEILHSNDSGFAQYLRSGLMEMEVKAFSGQDNNTGGYMIVPELYKEIIGGMFAKSPMRKLCQVDTISTNALDILMEEGDLASAWVAENDARGETNTPRFSQKRILVHELYAQPKATQKLLDDSAININSWLTSRLVDSFVKAENHSFILGDGNNKPRGILSYAADVVERVDVDTEGTLAMEDLLNLIHNMSESYLANASFLMHRSTLLEIQKLKDDNGRFLWQPAISSDSPETLFGIPVVCSSDMPRFAGGALGIILADFKEAYKIIDRKDITIMRDPFTEKPFVKFYSVKRVGGDVVNQNAVKIMKL
jgi:HK97 family phage major capsid protein/HK97 family phage prohead protease